MKYIVKLERVDFFEMEVEADTEDEAMQAAVEAFNQMEDTDSIFIGSDGVEAVSANGTM